MADDKLADATAAFNAGQVVIRKVGLYWRGLTATPSFGRVVSVAPKTLLVQELRYNGDGTIRELWQHRWPKDRCLIASGEALVAIAAASKIRAEADVQIALANDEAANRIQAVLQPVKDDLGAGA